MIIRLIYKHFHKKKKIADMTDMEYFNHRFMKAMERTQNRPYTK